MKQIYADSIEKAKSYYSDFDDLAHNLSHSERVAGNAIEIARSLGYQDLKFIELCAYWHDTARTKGLNPHEEPGAAMAREDLLSRRAKETIGNKAYEAIRLHRVRDNPTTIEGKVIRDADKLDLISIERWQKCIKAKQYEHLVPIVPLLKKFPRAFSFDYTKKLYAERFPKFWEYYESIKDQLPAA